MHLSAVQKRRTANFRDDETKLLIQLWGSPFVQSQINSSHRKGPIMVQIAAMMHQYGFYRTPEEITTRIRNLKCIYHRIKRAQNSGAYCTEGPDWHHFKALDAILGRSSSTELRTEPIAKVKKEPGVETSDNAYTFSNVCSPSQEGVNLETSTPVSPMEGTTASIPAVQDSLSEQINGLPYSFSEKSMKMQHSATSQSHRPPRIPEECTTESSSYAQDHHKPEVDSKQVSPKDKDVTSLLQQLLDVEREHLELEKQRLAFDRQIGAQLMCLVPIVSSILQKHAAPQHTENNWHFSNAQRDSDSDHN
ncbi:uncharacterized protein LOC124596299 [Schistocerca americana]|uniref:uncharacterized protein LOC124596299 n=1 Tax=Schistocerca americana TaxID=7009 RepID=UPI001F4F190D|nr:uncharacterized protein LOC124596299 [Schistocerca americana]XP_047109015.1 uncharacterized protein LOC124777596 [Schistocerca piceifrons]XP_049948636.1 uncharacterized protein LOC126456863 [Schistocerca serialis cubense]